LSDPDDPIPLLFNFDGGDYVVMTRVLIGLLPVSDHLLAHGDLYPVDAPDGAITLQDLVLLQKLLLQ